MHNYPDDIGAYICPSCKNIVTNCTCEDSEEVEIAVQIEEALYSEDGCDYYSMFDSIDSDTTVELLRKFHANPSEENKKLLLKQLDFMLNHYIRSKFE